MYLKFNNTSMYCKYRQVHSTKKDKNLHKNVLQHLSTVGGHIQVVCSNGTPSLTSQRRQNLRTVLHSFLANWDLM